MLPTSNPTPMAVREALIPALNTLLADATVLYSTAKQAHWNVRGPLFRPLHKLFDDVASAAAGWADTIAERVAALGGTVEGTLAQAVGASHLRSNAPLGHDATVCLSAVREGLARFSKAARALQETAEGDLATQDVGIEVQRASDKLLWMCEATLLP